ncbi:MAG: hypothetical protein MHPSP_004754, partial [Paramarteilia canceri]
MSGDVTKGEKLFKQRCGQCHVADKEANLTGPYLQNLIGRQSGKVPGFSYSQANKDR